MVDDFSASRSGHPQLGETMKNIREWLAARSWATAGGAVLDLDGVWEASA